MNARKPRPPGSFAAAMAKAGLNPPQYADLLVQLGATEEREAIMPRVRRWMTDSAAPNGEAVALLEVIARLRGVIGGIVAPSPKRKTSHSIRRRPEKTRHSVEAIG